MGGLGLAPYGQPYRGFDSPREALTNNKGGAIMDMVSSALGLEKKGWKVFPVSGKTPLVKWTEQHGADHSRWRAATGIGVDCGASALIVIDIDDPEGLRILEEKLGRTLAQDGTLQSSTGKGWHFFYKANGATVSNSASKIAKGVDVRGAGGYVVVPPSLHPDGRRYEWVKLAEPVDIPQDLLEICSAKPEAKPELLERATVSGDLDPWTQRALQDECNIVRGALEGTRNDTLYRAGLKMFSIANGGRVSHAEVFSALEASALANSMGTPMDPYEIKATLESARENAVEVRHPVSKEPNTILSASLPHVPDKAQAFEPMTVDELQNLPEPRWLLKNRIPEGQTWVYGPPGTGKTFVTLDWAAAVASSGKTVIAFIGEGVSGYAQRVRAWREENPSADMAGFLAVPQAPHLLDSRSVELLVNTVRDNRPDLIVIDTFARSLVGGDENSAQDVGRAIDVLDRLYRTYGASSLVVHHSKKSGGEERGSGAIRGAADATWEVTSYQGTSEFDAIEATCQKMKDAERPSPWLMQLRARAGSAVVYPSARNDAW